MNRREQDVSQVFDRQWNVNHNYQEVKKFHENRRKHFSKMYNIPDKEQRKQEILEANSVNGRVKRLEENMRGTEKTVRSFNINEFKNNFR